MTDTAYIDTLKRYTVELDTVFGEASDEETIEDTCSKLAAGVAGIRWKVVNLHGPGGGWPIVEWNGTRGQLYHLLLDHYDFTVEDAQDWLKD